MIKQRLYLPINFENVVTQYNENENHYGIRIEGSRKLLQASGKGRVRATGFSNVWGGFVCVAYDDVTCRSGKNIGTVLIRYCHLSEVHVKKRVPVDSQTVLGLVGSNGGLYRTFLLYIEADKDIKYPCHTPCILVPSGDLKVGLRGDRDTTFDPLLIFHNR